MTRTAVSSASRSSSICIAATIACESGLMRSPRLSVSVATPPLVSLSTKGCSAVSRGAFIVSSVDRARRSRAFAKQEFLDLAGGRLGQLTENHSLRRLEAREHRAAMLDQLGLGDLRVRLDLDERARRLSPFLVRLRHHRGGEHRGMAVQRVFHLERADILATRNDYVLRPVLDLDVAVLLHDREIAGMKPAAG